MTLREQLKAAVAALEQRIEQMVPASATFAQAFLKAYKPRFEQALAQRSTSIPDPGKTDLMSELVGQIHALQQAIDQCLGQCVPLQRQPTHALNMSGVSHETEWDHYERFKKTHVGAGVETAAMASWLQQQPGATVHATARPTSLASDPVLKRQGYSPQQRIFAEIMRSQRR